MQSQWQVVVSSAEQTVAGGGFGFYVVPGRNRTDGAPARFPVVCRLDMADARTFVVTDGRARYHPEGFRVLEVLGARPGDEYTFTVFGAPEDGLGGGLSGREDWLPGTLLYKAGAAGSPWPAADWGAAPSYLCNHLGKVQLSAPAPVDVRRYTTVGLTLTADLYRAPGFPSSDTMMQSAFLEVLAGPGADAPVLYQASRTLQHREACTLVMGRGLADGAEAFSERFGWRGAWVRVGTTVSGGVSEVRSTLELWGAP